MQSIAIGKLGLGKANVMVTMPGDSGLQSFPPAGWASDLTDKLLTAARQMTIINTEMTENMWLWLLEWYWVSDN